MKFSSTAALAIAQFFAAANSMAIPFGIAAAPIGAPSKGYGNFTYGPYNGTGVPPPTPINGTFNGSRPSEAVSQSPAAIEKRNFPFGSPPPIPSGFPFGGPYNGTAPPTPPECNGTFNASFNHTFSIPKPSSALTDLP